MLPGRLASGVSCYCYRGRGVGTLVERPETPARWVPADCICGEEGSLSNLQLEYLRAEPSNLGSLDPLMITGPEAERQCRKQFNQGSQRHRHRIKGWAMQPAGPPGTWKMAFLCNSGLRRVVAEPSRIRH